MADQEEDRKPGNEGALHCLECGVVLPADAESCIDCGNERLIMPERWIPPGESRPRSENSRRLGRETRILVGLSLALFCALGLLSVARARNAALIQDDGPDNMQIVLENDVQRVTELPLEEPMLSVEPDRLDIGILRIAATSLQESGAWYDAADAWSRVTDHPDAALDDFLALADVCERADSPGAAQAALNRACVRFPENTGGYLAMGAYQEDRGNHNAALLQYQLGLTYSENDPELMSGLLRCEEELGLIEEPPPAEPEQPEGTLEALIESQPVPDPLPEPVLPLEPEPDGIIPVTLIGWESTLENDNSGVPGESAQVEGSQFPEGEEETQILIEIIDLRLDATLDSVTVELTTDRPAELISSQADEPPRLVVRLPGARIRPGANVPSTVTLNTPLVERVNLFETSADTSVVLLIIYLGQETRYTVGSDATTVRVTIGRRTGG